MLLIILFLFTAKAPAQQVLPLSDFIQEVQRDNGNYVTSAKKNIALELRGDEWKLLARPNLIGGVEDTRDQRLTGAPTFQGTQTNIKSYSLGLHQTTNFGLDATLSYKYVDTNIQGVNPQFFPQPHYIMASPVLELNQSLWKNFLGAQTNAKRETDAAQVRSDRYNEQFNLLKTKSDAETAYWQLVVARKLVTAAKGNLERAERILSWYTRRSQMQLTDRSDLLQGEAIVATRKVELQTALADERAKSRAFNVMRNSDAEEVKETLSDLKYEQIVQLKAPERAGARKDILAAEQLAIADKGRAKQSEEANKPDISAYANLSTNGRNPNPNTTVNQSFSSTYPMTVVGVKLNVPLSLGIASDTRQGYRVQAESSDILYRRKNYETERLWLDLNRKFEDAKNRLGLAIELEKAQKKKVEFEKDRHGRGRTTTYQVIQFEQDYATAQVSRINLESDILNFHAQLKTFGGAQ